MFCVRNASGAMLLLSVFFGVGFQSAFAQSQTGSTTADFDYLPAAIELGPARAYNGFFLDDFESISAHTQGRLAAGGDITINHYQVADQLQAGASGASLVVGGDLNFPEGQVHRGDILVGGNAAGLGSAVIDALTPEQSVHEFAELPVDFESAFAVIRTTSQTLASLPANGSVDWLSGELHLSGDCEGRAQVFALNGQQLLDATTFELSCIPDGATVIFNIDGQHSGLIDLSLTSLAPHRQNTLFNFHQAELLSLSGVEVHGSILAPLAHVDQPQASINGQVIARSWNGPMKLNHVPFRGIGAGDFCAMYPIALPFDLLESSAPETTFDQVPRGTGAGQFSWLTWAGSPNAPVLANSLIPPGDSYTYVNPDDDSAWPLAPEHWVEGAAGSMNSGPVRANLDVLIGTEIVVPAWSAIRGQGNNLDYQVAEFARIRLLDYRLTGNGWLSFEFVGWTHCYNRPPIAFDQHLETETNTPIDIELSGEDPDGDELTFEIVTQPANGQLVGEPPQVQYIPNPDFSGTDSFEFSALDGFLTSQPATITIDVIRSNLPPEIISTPDASVDADQVFGYLVEAIDPDGDQLVYSLDEYFPDTNINSDSGWMTWLPAEHLIQGVSAANTQCRLPTDPTFSFDVDPVMKWRWGNQRVLSVPLVGPFFDTNGDGLYDDEDIPTVAILSHAGFVDSASATLRFLNGETGVEISSVPGIQGRASSHAAWGDLTGDGRPEIVMWMHNGNIAAVTPDGELLWQNTETTNNHRYNYSAINLADINQDGTPEILAREYVLSSTGELLWKAEGNYWHRVTSFAVDLTGDDQLEIIVGGRVFDSSGGLLWSIPVSAGNALGVTADFTGDGQPEVAFYVGSTMSLYRSDGTELWSGVPVPGGGGGAPTVADFTGDGRPEIGIAGRSRYAVFNADGELVWAAVVQDFSSRTTGSTVFDFNGDGRAEVVYADERFLRIYEGATGRVLYQVPNGSATASEYPVVADINGNGSAEILVVSDQGSTTGIRAFRDIADRWMPTRRIWNQYDYHIDNINDDGTIPSSQKKSWLSHNTFRLNTFADEHPLGQPDLALFNLRLEGNVVKVAAVNRGLAPTREPVTVHLFNGTSQASARFLSEVTLDPMPVGSQFDLHFEINPDDLYDSVLYAVIDPEGRIEECDANNNWTSAGLFQVRATDPGGLFDTQRFSVNVKNVNRAPTIDTVEVLSASINSQYLFPIEASDPDIGDALAFSIESGPEGLRIEGVSGVISWSPSEEHVGQHSFVVKVTDLGGLSASREFVIDVLASDVPVFVSEPVTEAPVNGLYRYDALAIDPDDLSLQYALMLSPEGMEIDTVTGRVHWVPSLSQVGAHQVSIRAINSSQLFALQNFTVTVTDDNSAPVIVSEPPTIAYLNEVYTYQVLAIDDDGDDLIYGLLTFPDGMVIDNGSGLIEWEPADAQVGSHIVEIEVSDGRGGKAYQSFVLTVEHHHSPNQPPEITSTPPLQVDLGEQWIYAVEAFDPDDDPLAYEILQGPDGAVIDQSGVATWTPQVDQLGANDFVIEVRDDRGGWARQSFSVYVNDAAVNSPPEILSTPPLTAVVGGLYSYQVDAVDPDGDVLEYVLPVGPSGAVIGSADGLLTWTPDESQLGENDFEIHVLDGNGGVAWQHFTVVVEGAPIGNQPPVIHSAPPLTGKAGFGYRYEIVASDPDGDELAFSLVEGPDGMALDAATGELTWLPEAQGLYPVTISVADDEFTVSQSWQLEVLDGAVPLSLTLEISPTVADVGQTVEIRLIPEAAAGQVVAEVMVNDTVVTVDPDLIARYVPSEPGEHVVLAGIDDGFEQAQANDSFFVRDPDAEGGPFVSLSTPDYEAEITAPTMIIGTVQDDDLDTWVLAWAEAGTQNWTILAEGSEVIDEADIAMFDPTLLINGQYRIALQAWDSQGRMSSDSREIQVTGDMKLGHFAITFEDATVPLSGIPITLTRTYDTRQRHQNLDFGFGWSVGYQDVRLHESRRVGLGWSLNEYRQGFFSTWCVEPNGDPIVTVRLPDDEVHRFKAKAEPECQQLVPFIDVHIVFEALPGTHSELEQLDHGMVRLINGNIAELDEPDTPIDPDRYRLTLEDGTVLRIDQHFGLRQLTDGDANTLTFTRDGITHSSGVGIDFVRDSH
jgi:choice-of-anchor A domain-containing protein